MNTTRFFLSQKVACVGVGCALLAMLAACDNPVSSDRGPVGRIVFQASGLSTDIFVMNADGTGVVNLTESPESDVLPSWSPDGSRIAFMSDRDGNSEIYLMNADGTRPVNLTNHRAHDSSPTWSPDGSRIAFLSDRDGNGEIYLMNADGTRPVNLTNTPEHEGRPFWSPRE